MNIIGQDGSGAAVQVWEERHGTIYKYCLLSGWQQSGAYRRIQQDSQYSRPKRSLYDEYGLDLFGGGPIHGVQM